MMGYIIGLQLRSASQSLIYDKITRLRFVGGSNSGEAINMISSDCQRICESGQNFAFLLSTPFIIIATIIIMYFLLGNAVFIGFAVLFLLIPLQSHFGTQTGKYRSQSAKIADKRIKMMNEILTGVKLVSLV